MHTVSLDWITPDTERVIARHARVSTSNPDREEYVRLVNHCIKHGHWSILEQVNASFEIITSRAISTQLIRHRTFAFQELSQRYCNPFEVITDNHDNPAHFELRKQAEKNRQSSTDAVEENIRRGFRDRIDRLDVELRDLYSEMLEAGVARECARNILPLYTPTRIHMQGTVRSWCHWVGLRGKEDTQLEHRTLATQIAMLLALEIPTVTKALVGSDDPALEGWKCLLKSDGTQD